VQTEEGRRTNRCARQGRKRELKTHKGISDITQAG